MNLTEALEWAADYAERNKLFVPPTNNRGYPVDGWKHPDAAEKSSIIRALAREVMESEKPQTEPTAFYDFMESQIIELRAIRAVVVEPAGTRIQEVSNRLENVLKEMKRGSGNR